MKKPILHFTLHGQVRGGKNHIQITRTGRRYPLKGFQEWAQEAIRQIQAQEDFPEEPWECPIYLGIDYTPGDKRIRDAPAIVESICHVLENCGVIVNDKQVERLAYAKLAVEKDNPRCSFLIMGMDWWC